MEQKHRKPMTIIADISKQITAIAGAVVIVWLVLTFALEGKVRELARDVAGTDEVVAAVEVVAIEQKEQRVLLEEVTTRVEALEPIPRIVEYDDLFSKAEGPCARGMPCSYVYLLRRTDYGRACGAPQAERVFRDHVGIVFFPSRTIDAQPRQRDTEWSYFAGDFVVPETAALGMGEFHLDLIYPDCGPDRNQTIKERSLPLRVEIVEEF